MIDLLLDKNGDLLIRNNDLVIGDSDNQNALDIIQSAPGEYKLSPQIGVDANYYLNNPDAIELLKSKVKLQLGLDGFRVLSVDVSIVNGQIFINPQYTR